MTWMAWTQPTAIFFIGIVTMLVVMSVLEVKRPTIPRVGWLGFATTRGDRLFIGLLVVAFIHVTWLALSDLPLWIASGLALMVAVGIMRRG